LCPPCATRARSIAARTVCAAVSLRASIQRNAPSLSGIILRAFPVFPKGISPAAGRGCYQGRGNMHLEFVLRPRPRPPDSGLLRPR
jgi:hypothetical protein